VFPWTGTSAAEFFRPWNLEKENLRRIGKKFQSQIRFYQNDVYLSINFTTIGIFGEVTHDQNQAGPTDLLHREVETEV
jgi:hypothetical protein